MVPGGEAAALAAPRGWGPPRAAGGGASGGGGGGRASLLRLVALGSLRHGCSLNPQASAVTVAQAVAAAAAASGRVRGAGPVCCSRHRPSKGSRGAPHHHWDDTVAVVVPCSRGGGARVGAPCTGRATPLCGGAPARGGGTQGSKPSRPPSHGHTFSTTAAIRHTTAGTALGPSVRGRGAPRLHWTGGRMCSWRYVACGHHGRGPPPARSRQQDQRHRHCQHAHNGPCGDGRQDWGGQPAAAAC